MMTIEQIKNRISEYERQLNENGEFELSEGTNFERQARRDDLQHLYQSLKQYKKMGMVTLAQEIYNDNSEAYITNLTTYFASTIRTLEQTKEGLQKLIERISKTEMNETKNKFIEAQKLRIQTIEQKIKKIQICMNNLNNKKAVANYIMQEIGNIDDVISSIIYSEQDLYTYGQMKYSSQNVMGGIENRNATFAYRDDSGQMQINIPNIKLALSHLNNENPLQKINTRKDKEDQLRNLNEAEKKLEEEIRIFLSNISTYNGIISQSPILYSTSLLQLSEKLNLQIKEWEERGYDLKSVFEISIIKDTTQRFMDFANMFSQIDSDFSRFEIEINPEIIQEKITNAATKRKEEAEQEFSIADAAITDRDILEANQNAIERLVYYGRGRIGQEGDYSFNTVRTNLTLLLIADKVKKQQLGYKDILTEEEIEKTRQQTEQNLQNFYEEGKEKVDKASRR